jgi:hypothetical protein
MGGQQKDFISDIVFFQHQDGMRLKVRRHFLQCIPLSRFSWQYSLSRQQRRHNCLVRRNSIPEREIDEDDTVTAELQVNLRKLAAPAPAPTRPKPLLEVAPALPTRPKPLPETAPALPTSSVKAAQTDPTRSSLVEEESFLADFLIKEAVHEEEEEEGGDPRAEDEEVREAFRGWPQVDIAPAHRDGSLLLVSNSKGWISSETEFNCHNLRLFIILKATVWPKDLPKSDNKQFFPSILKGTVAPD